MKSVLVCTCTKEHVLIFFEKKRKRIIHNERILKTNFKRNYYVNRTKN